MQKGILITVGLLGAASLLYLHNAPPIEAISNEVQIVTVWENYVPQNERVTYERQSVQFVDIALSEDLQEYTYELCEEYNVDYSLALAVMWQESNFEPNLISATDDYGLMQINVVNHKWLSNLLGIVDFLDPKQNLQAGIYMLSMLKEKYEDDHLVLMAYNYGEGGAKLHWASGEVTSRYSLQVHSRKEVINSLFKDI